MTPYKRFGALSSSVDPEKLALTVVGLINLVGGILVTLGFITIADQTTIMDNVNVLVQQLMLIIPAATAIVGSVQTIVGIIRKVIVHTATVGQ